MCKFNASAVSKDMSSYKYNINEDTKIKFDIHSTTVSKVTENPTMNPSTIETCKHKTIFPNVKKHPVSPPYCVLSNKNLAEAFAAIREMTSTATGNDHALVRENKINLMMDDLLLH